MGEKREHAAVCTARDLAFDSGTAPGEDDCTEQRLERVLEAVADGFFDSDLTTGNTRYSASWWAMLGYAPGGVDGADPAWTLMHPDDRAVVQATLDACNAPPDADHYTDLYAVEFRVRDADGHWRWMLSRGRITRRDETGRALCMVGTHMDITARKQAEREQARSEERFRLLVENMGELVVKTDEFGHIRFASPSYLELFGKLEDDILDRCFEPMVHEDDRAEAVRALEALYDPPHASRVELRTMTAKGWRWLSWSYKAALDEYGRMLSMVGVGRDVTARKQVEAVTQSLYQVSYSVSSTRDLKTLFRSIHDILKEHIAAENFFISLVDEDGKSLTFPYFADEVDEAYEGRIRLDGEVAQGLTAHVIRTAGPLFVRAPDMRRAMEDGAYSVVGTLPAVWLGVPLLLGSEVVGVMAVQHYADPDHFTQQDVSLMVSVSEQVALAIERRRNEMALAQSEAWFRSIFDSAAVGIVLSDRSGRITQVNRAFGEMTGYSEAEMLEHRVEEHAAPDEPPLNPRRLLARLREADIWREERRYVRKDGSELWADLSVAPIRDTDGRLAAFMGVCLDITERKRSAQRLEQALAELDTILENSLVGIMVLRDSTMASVNGRLCELFGYQREELVGQSVAALHVSSQNYREFGILYFSRLGRAEFKNIEYPLKKSTGGVIWCRISGKALDKADPSLGSVWCVDDITEERKAQESLKRYAKDLIEAQRVQEDNARKLARVIEELDEKNVRLEQEARQRREVEAALRESERRYRELSIRDELTGLFNSRHFYQQAEAEMRRTKRYGRDLSLLFMDIDDFKRYNDAHGHMEGDKVLRALGRVLGQSIRDTDAAFRYGGEEFVVLLPETGLDEAMAMAERIREAFAATAFDPGADHVSQPVSQPVSQTVSIGAAQYAPDEKLSAFISRADGAMYEAKRSGKDRVVTAGPPPTKTASPASPAAD